MTKTFTHKVDPVTTPQRLQEYGVGIFEHAVTKSALKKALKKQYITVNNQIATTATMINGGEEIKLFIPENLPPTKQLNFPLTVLYEDDHLACIHKPAGILVSGNSFKTIARALPQNLKPSTRPGATKPQPVHRLDYATTGLLLVGKTTSGIRQLNTLFETKKIQKEYYAIVIGTPAPKGKITTPIDDKESTSIYEVKQRVDSKRFGTLSLVKLHPKTGRRHQLRKHLSGIDHPILGDSTYGNEGMILRKKGLYLHAFSLEFEHPATGKKILITDPLPKKFEKIFPPRSDPSNVTKS